MKIKAEIEKEVKQARVHAIRQGITTRLEDVLNTVQSEDKNIATTLERVRRELTNLTIEIIELCDENYFKGE